MQIVSTLETVRHKEMLKDLGSSNLERRERKHRGEKKSNKTNHRQSTRLQNILLFDSWGIYVVGRSQFLQMHREFK